MGLEARLRRNARAVTRAHVIESEHRMPALSQRAREAHEDAMAPQLLLAKRMAHHKCGARRCACRLVQHAEQMRWTTLEEKRLFIHKGTGCGGNGLLRGRAVG